MTSSDSFYHAMTTNARVLPPRRAPTSPISLELPIQAPPTPINEASRLCHGPHQHVQPMPSPGVISMQASIAGTAASATQTIRPSIKRKPVPAKTKYVEIEAPIEASETSSMPPPAPTRSEFPGDPLEYRHLATTNPTLPSEDEVQAYFAKLEKLKIASKMKDPYHRTIHDSYPHVFKPKSKPGPRPRLNRNETNRVSEAFSHAFKGFKNSIKSFAAHRHRPIGGPNGVGMSIPINDSFHDFLAQTQGFRGVLHPDLKLVPVHEARTKFAGQHKSIETGSAAKPKRSVANPWMSSIAEDGERMPLPGDLDANDLFDSSIEDLIESPLPRPRIRRARNGMNRGSSKPLPPLPKEAWLPPEGYFEAPKTRHPSVAPEIPERNPRRLHAPSGEQTGLQPFQPKHNVGPVKSALPSPALQLRVLELEPTSPVDWTEIHRGTFPSGRRVLYDPATHTNVQMPRFDSPVSPRSPVAGYDDEEASKARRTAYLGSEQQTNTTEQGGQSNLNRSQQAAVEYHFDSIDDAVARDSKLSEGDRRWAREELHRMDEILDRDRRASDGSIVIDTFPHDAHTSWRATERTSDHVIHSDYRRFSREGFDDDKHQDDATLLMERLSRQVRGL